MMLFLIYELQKGDKSIWKPWFDILPKKITLLYNWDEEDLLELQDVNLMNSALNQCDHLYSDWMTFHKCLSKYPDLFT
jgi:hypothetical protein